MKYSGKALCFDDILLVPQRSSISSRHDVDLSMSIGHGKRKIGLKLPLIAAPMDTVCDTEMCIALHKEGAIGILHRYMSHDDQIEKSKDLISNKINFGVAIASNNGYLAQAKRLYDIGVRIFLVDTANGHGDYAVRAVDQLRLSFSDAHIMAGNVATSEGFIRLAEAGADSIRVGIGGGGLCTTRIVSGHGVPTLQSILDVSERNFTDCSIIADGGIRNSGDMVKCFAAGADAVMVGSMIAGSKEAPGKWTTRNGKPWKVVRGMASASAQKDANGKVSVAEGISTFVQGTGPIKNLLSDIRGGLGSGCSYSGVEEISTLFYSSEYKIVSQASISESHPHTNEG